MEGKVRKKNQHELTKGEGKVKKELGLSLHCIAKIVRTIGGATVDWVLTANYANQVFIISHGGMWYRPTYRGE